MAIRRAEASDIPRVDELLFQVQKIHAEGRNDIFKLGTKKYSSDELKEIFACVNTPVFVYEDENGVQGYAFCILQDTPEDARLYARRSLYIDDLCVDAHMRGKGIGRKLYEHVTEFARQMNCDSITLNVWALNESAYSFYRKLGLSPLKTVMEQKLK